MIQSRFDYQTLNRVSDSGTRRYQTPTGNLPSVTTILSATKSAESRQALAAWRTRLGEAQAQAVTTEAANRGTRMHRWLENYVTQGELGQPGSNPFSQQSWRMAQALVEGLLKPNLGTVWGSEVSLYYPELYAGTTDLVADWQGELSILDFKQTNRPKKTQYISDYFTQLAAYQLAHDCLYGTQIRQAVILMCDPNCEIQCWVIRDQELENWAQCWTQRVAQYFSIT